MGHKSQLIECDRRSCSAFDLIGKSDTQRERPRDGALRHLCWPKDASGLVAIGRIGERTTSLVCGQLQCCQFAHQPHICWTQALRASHRLVALPLVFDVQASESLTPACHRHC